MSMSKHRRLTVLDKLRSYSMEHLFRLCNSARREWFQLDQEWAMMRMTRAGYDRRMYVKAVHTLIECEIDRRLAEPIGAAA